VSAEVERRRGNGAGWGGPARGAGRGGPARGGEATGSWEPFAEENELQLRHGCYAEVRLSKDERIQELAEQIRATQPVSHPADSGAIERLAITYRRCELAAAAIDRVDQELSDPATGYAVSEASEWLGRLRDDLARWLREAGRIEEQLGRTPQSRAKLGLNIALGRRALSVVELHEAAALEAEE
jgi:hypothetical protein